MDPDQQIQQAIRLLFESFTQLGSVMAVVKKFNTEHLLFTRRIRRGIGKGDLLWGALEHTRVIQILHNPRYAGAFVYGRTLVAVPPNCALHLLKLHVTTGKSLFQTLI
ncbi:MAG: recombinase family protein [Alphaproteobacteria bacterium]